MTDKKEATKTEAPAKVAKPSMAEQNGITMPRPETACGQIWALADVMSTEIKAPIAVAELLEKALLQGYNPATIKTQYARWRKFHGVQGRVESEASKAKKAEVAAGKEKRLADAEASKLAKAEAKVAKDAEKLAKAEKVKADKEAKAKEKADKEAKAKEKADKAAKAKADKEAKAKAGAAKKVAPTAK